jgi:hypothetical protein
MKSLEFFTNLFNAEFFKHRTTQVENEEVYITSEQFEKVVRAQGGEDDEEDEDTKEQIDHLLELATMADQDNTGKIFKHGLIKAIQEDMRKMFGAEEKN